MNWISFVLIAWILLGLDRGLVDAFQLGNLAIAPSLLMILLAYVAMWAPTTHALWAAIIIGTLLDLTSPIHTESGPTVVIVGPHALGCLLGASLVLNLRSLMFRKNMLTVAFLSFLAMLISEIVITASLSFRHMYDVIVFAEPLDELLMRSASAVYTGLFALPIGFILMTIRPVFGFEHGHGRLSFVGRP